MRPEPSTVMRVWAGAAVCILAGAVALATEEIRPRPVELHLRASDKTGQGLV